MLYTASGGTGTLLLRNITNTPKRPTLAVAKTSTVTSDPFNDGTNPKRIPGSIVGYMVTVTNSGTGIVDASTLAITDPVPANTTLCVATICSNPVGQFVDGTPASAGASADACGDD